ncbi:MAG: hypothetical protein OEZ43_11065 [Gammaproteobacteria bacterium]|nr:hypothetical protein [Gammaproteobacteria bacterium]
MKRKLPVLIVVGLLVVLSSGCGITQILRPGDQLQLLGQATVTLTDDQRVDVFDPKLNSEGVTATSRETGKSVEIPRHYIEDVFQFSHAEGARIGAIGGATTCLALGALVNSDPEFRNADTGTKLFNLTLVPVFCALFGSVGGAIVGHKTEYIFDGYTDENITLVDFPDIETFHSKQSRNQFGIGVETILGGSYFPAYELSSGLDLKKAKVLLQGVSFSAEYRYNNSVTLGLSFRSMSPIDWAKRGESVDLLGNPTSYDIFRTVESWRLYKSIHHRFEGWYLKYGAGIDVFEKSLGTSSCCAFSTQTVYDSVSVVSAFVESGYKKRFLKNFMLTASMEASSYTTFSPLGALVFKIGVQTL